MTRNTKSISAAPKLILEPVRESSRLDSYPLAPGRYLIGASPECDIVITTGGVAPQHCLMLVGANKTIVKAISPLTWINDGPLTEAVLRHGERLILGPVELRTRRPEVSEWVEVQAPADLDDQEGYLTPSAVPLATPAQSATYQPPQIEELLDHARQQLQSVIDSSTPDQSRPEDLPLPTADAAPLDKAGQDREESSRILALLEQELTLRAEQQLTREQEIAARESQLQSDLAQVEQSKLALIALAEEQTRHRTEVARQLAEQDLAMEEARQQLQGRVADLQQQASALADRAHQLAAREVELASQAEALSQQSTSLRSFAAARPIDLSALEQRESTVARREAVLASSLAALQSARDQMAQEASVLEERFAELITRDQSILERELAVTKQGRQLEPRQQTTGNLQTELDERERVVVALAAEVQDREESLRTRKAEFEKRDRNLNGLRSELDIREEALNQQFGQLQFDRSSLRAAQAKFQSTEQAAHQRLADLEARLEQAHAATAAAAQAPSSGGEEASSPSQSAELEQHWADLAQARADFVYDKQELEALRAELETQRAHLAAGHTSQSHFAALPEIDSPIEAQRQQLAEERQQLEAERESFRALRDSSSETDEVMSTVGEHLQALLKERSELAHLQQQVEQEYRELRLERDETSRVRIKFEAQHEALQSIRTESESERDVYIAERQSLISERQSLQDRERQVKKTEEEIAQIRSDTEKAREELEFLQRQMSTQRRDLDEEWGSLRGERIALKQAEFALNSHREELTLLAQDLADMQAASSDAASAKEHGGAPHSAAEQPAAAAVPVTNRASNSPHDALVRERSADTDGQVEAAEDDPSEEVDSLAGMANFSTIGSSIDDDLPPEIAEIIRQSSEKSVPASAPTAQQITPPGPAIDTWPGSVAVPPPIPSPEPPVSAASPLDRDSKELQRLRDLLGRSSDSYVDAAIEQVGDEYADVEAEAEHVVEDEVVHDLPLDVIRSADDELVEVSEVLEAETAATPEETHSSELRSRLSQMFGINLSGLRQPHPTVAEEEPFPEDEATGDEAEADSEECSLPEDHSESSYPPIAQTQPQHQHQTPEQDSPPLESSTPAGEPLDPVAAYMEQLLARTRKSKDGHAVKSSPPAPAPTPTIVAPVVPSIPEAREIPVEKPTAVRNDETATRTSRSNRKLEVVDKEALRANLDSFRSIANNQARSNVARSEFRRLAIASKVKQIFLSISGGIALILLSTEFWTTRRYRLEILAAVAATAFLGFDYIRTQRRLRELIAIVPSEGETDSELESESNA